MRHLPHTDWNTVAETSCALPEDSWLPRGGFTTPKLNQPFSTLDFESGPPLKLAPPSGSVDSEVWRGIPTQVGSPFAVSFQWKTEMKLTPQQALKTNTQMNVTSLLNSSAAAQAAGGRLPTEQPTEANMAMYQTQDRMVPMRTSSDSRLTSRNSRTPWDAGGYSLPLTLNVKNGHMSPASKTAYQPEGTPMDTLGSTSPKSPKHKFSDSRSSLSSYTTMSSSTSCHSRSHSRISSLSTVSEYQPLSCFGSESTPTERRTSMPENGMCPTVVEIQPPSPRRLGMDEVSDASDNDSLMISDRARSPSDAVLLRNRGLAGSARYVSILSYLRFISIILFIVVVGSPTLGQ